MKTMSELTREFDGGLLEFYKSNGFEAVCAELRKRIEHLKAQVLTAWFAEHGFAPGSAVLVEESTPAGFKLYIREITTEEAERLQKIRLEDHASACPRWICDSRCAFWDKWNCNDHPCRIVR